MLPKIEVKPSLLDTSVGIGEGSKDLSLKHYEWCIAETLAEPSLTEEQKRELLRQLELTDDEWEPIKLPEGAEPVSVTIIKMRRGEA